MVEHTTNELMHEILCIFSQGSLQSLRNLFMEILNRLHSLLCLFIGSNSHCRLSIKINGVQRSLTTIFAGRNICPQGLNLLFDLIYIDITDNDNSLVIRSIPFMIIRTKCIVLKVIDDGRIADNIAFAILGVRIKFRANDIAHAAIGIVAGTPFFANNTTLGINFFRQEEQTTSPIMHNEECRVNNTLANSWHIRKTINSFVN